MGSDISAEPFASQEAPGSLRPEPVGPEPGDRRLVLGTPCRSSGLPRGSASRARSLWRG